MRGWMSHPLLIAASSILAGIALWFAPPPVVQRCRMTLFDSLKPGLELIHRVHASWNNWQSQWQEADRARLVAERNAARAEVERLELRVHRLAVQFAKLQRQTEVDSSQASQPGGPPALFLPALVEARVIGDALGQEWRAGQLISGGWRQGLREEALVLKSHQPLIDIGRGDQIGLEDPLLAGNRVVGKISAVGHWTSAFIPVTDPEFRAEVQLVRPSDLGPTWGARGILRGTGDGCQMTGLPEDTSVRPGDYVYSASRDGVFDAPLLYGTVQSAVLGDGDREWQVKVEPSATPQSVTHVKVLRAALNPQRLFAH